MKTRSTSPNLSKKLLLNLSLAFLITVCRISYFKICLWLFSFVITGKLGLVSISFFGNSRTTGLYIIGWVMLRGSITEHFGGNYDRKCSLHKRRGLSLIIILLLIQAYVYVRKQGEGKSELVVEFPFIIIKISSTYLDWLGLLQKDLPKPTHLLAWSSVITSPIVDSFLTSHTIGPTSLLALTQLANTCYCQSLTCVSYLYHYI